MKRQQLPETVLALNATLKANPQLTEQMGPVHLLSVPGRASGEFRSTPVSPLTHHGKRWLVSAFADADWVKNLRASGWGRLTKGARVERVSVVEVSLDQRAPVIRDFIQHMASGRFAFDLTPDSPLEAFAAAAERYPVFEIVTAEPIASQPDS
jgi:deazaflavin-dependent oxidoreductase (nitroreductase family)